MSSSVVQMGTKVKVTLFGAIALFQVYEMHMHEPLKCPHRTYIVVEGNSQLVMFLGYILCQNVMGSMEKGREQDMGKEKHGGKARYNINRLHIWTDVDYTIIAHILKI